MCTEQFTRLAIKYRFNQTFRFPKRNSFAITDKREAADFDLMPCRFGLCFGMADASDLRMTIGTARNGIGVQRMRI